MVYDCGSENKNYIKQAINKYKRESSTDCIDLLVLSHLHYDHVSGLEELFNNFKVKDVILPYLYPVQRLILSLRNTKYYISNKWYFSFLSDPPEYLLKEKKVEKVILIGSKEDNEGINEPDSSPTEIPPGDNENKDFLKLYISEFTIKKSIPIETGWKEYIGKKKLIGLNYKKSAFIKLGKVNVWILKFFNYKISKDLISKIKKDLKKCFDIEKENNEIKNLIKDHSKLNDLKKCYGSLKKHLENINNTSLVLYHGPSDDQRLKELVLNLRLSDVQRLRKLVPYLCDELEFYRKSIKLNSQYPFGQLLTGDIDLNFNYDEIFNHFSKCLNHVLIGMIPHHGAKNNWNDKFLHNCCNSKLWVVSAGINNKYRHPSPCVLMEVIYNNKCIVWINQRVSIIIEFIFI